MFTARPNPRRSLLTRAALVVALAVQLAACDGGSALGYESPPAALDPGSPTIGASAIAFDRTQLDVPASRAFVLIFENREAVPHNVSIYRVTPRTRVFEGVVFSGPATRWYPVPALAPGTYELVCDVHPTMTGTVVAS